MVQLNYRDAKPIYEQVRDGIRRLIISNAFRTGEMLPSVREMASKLAINPNTIARAYRELEDEGYLYSGEEEGVYVSSIELVQAKREQELLEKFDEKALELVCFGVSTDVLKKRLDMLKERNNSNDTGK